MYDSNIPVKVFVMFVIDTSLEGIYYYVYIFDY